MLHVRRNPMALDESKVTLSAADAASLQGARSSAVQQLLNPTQRLANVQGVGDGIKWTDGQPTGQPAVVVLVSQKLQPDLLGPDDMVPSAINGVPTDVLAVGDLFAGGGDPADAGIQTLARRIRPAEGGYSVGHFQITAGTIATMAYDILPG